MHWQACLCGVKWLYILGFQFILFTWTPLLVFTFKIANSKKEENQHHISFDFQQDNVLQTFQKPQQPDTPVV